MFPPSVADFKAFFVRDFNYAASDDQTNYNLVVDADITKAIDEALINFNNDLFGEDSVAVNIFMYLAAFHLVSNLQTSAKGISSQSKFPINSNSVGGVAITFQIPDRYSKDAFLNQYTQNGYGMKYISLALPFMVGVTSFGLRRTSSQ